MRTTAQGPQPRLWGHFNRSASHRRYSPPVLARSRIGSSPVG